MLENLEMGRFPTQVDWSSVSSVAVISVKQWVPHPYVDDTKRAVQVLYGGNRGFAMIAPDAAMAVRIVYAMEFLRSACDAGGDTGF